MLSDQHVLSHIFPRVVYRHLKPSHLLDLFFLEDGRVTKGNTVIFTPKIISISIWAFLCFRFFAFSSFAQISLPIHITNKARQGKAPRNHIMELWKSVSVHIRTPPFWKPHVDRSRCYTQLSSSERMLLYIFSNNNRSLFFGREGNKSEIVYRATFHSIGSRKSKPRECNTLYFSVFTASITKSQSWADTENKTTDPWQFFIYFRFPHSTTTAFLFFFIRGHCELYRSAF